MKIVSESFARKNLRMGSLYRPAAAFFLSLLLASCTAGLSNTRVGPPQAQPGKGVVDITLLQMNDVYELTPVSGGREGGLARVAAIRKELLAENPNTITLLDGSNAGESAAGPGGHPGGAHASFGRSGRDAGPIRAGHRPDPGRP